MSLSGSSQQVLPPLVVKVCQNFKHHKIPIEAAVYEELQPHGSSLLAIMAVLKL